MNKATNRRTAAAFAVAGAALAATLAVHHDLTPDTVTVFTAVGGNAVIELSGSDLDALGQCPTEDSADCYWSAGVQGNGSGRSFVDVGGVAYYAPTVDSVHSN